ncbi:hypothetical protein ACFYNO_06845 [Kitasatospora sp. NPDC006697]|uniref:hypothetical protein n=1 Tax=Kitasatospora sp. NPDC006697 TaxID=3364020 RepID=UPI003688588C
MTRRQRTATRHGGGRSTVAEPEEAGHATSGGPTLRARLPVADTGTFAREAAVDRLRAAWEVHSRQPAASR